MIIEGLVLFTAYKLLTGKRTPQPQVAIDPMAYHPSAKVQPPRQLPTGVTQIKQGLLVPSMQDMVNVVSQSSPTINPAQKLILQQQQQAELAAQALGPAVTQITAVESAKQVVNAPSPAALTVYSTPPLTTYRTATVSKVVPTTTTLRGFGRFGH